MSKLDYEVSRKIAIEDPPFYARIIAAHTLAVLNGDQVTADKIFDCWSREMNRPYDKQIGVKILDLFTDATVTSLLMSAMRDADSNNTMLFQRYFPESWNELGRRYHSPGGILPEDTEEVSQR